MFEKKKKICGKIRTNIYRDQKKKLNQKKEDENEEGNHCSAFW